MLLAIECGYRYRFFGDDAVAAAQCLGFASWKDHNFMVRIGSPLRSLPSCECTFSACEFDTSLRPFSLPSCRLPVYSQTF